MAGAGSRAKGGSSKAKGSKSLGGGGAPTPENPAPATPAGVLAAFEASPGAARDNFVALADIRARLGGTRAEQDKAINALRDRKVLTLDTHEGRFKVKDESYRKAAIYESPDKNGMHQGPDGRTYATRYVYAAKRGR